MENERQRVCKRWLYCAVGLLPVVAYVILNYLMLDDAFVVCPFRALSGYPCPGCGLTHAGMALLRLDIKSRLEYHALFIPVVCTLLLVFFPKGILRIVDWAKRQYWWYALLVVAMFAYYGFRLHSCYPGKYPMCRVSRNYFNKLGITKPSPITETDKAIPQK